MPNEIVTLWIRQATTAGKSLDQIDEEIIEPSTLSDQQKGALLLFAYSLRRRGEQRRYARECLEVAGMSLPRTAAQDPSDPPPGLYLEHRSGRDRRSSHDRRERQDRVATERRSGLERRRDHRRRQDHPASHITIRD
jgi:hypothetical protein